MMPEENESWNSYQKLVLAELRRLDNWCTVIDGKTNEILIEVATLKTKSAFWGGAAGLIFAAIATGVATHFMK